MQSSALTPLARDPARSAAIPSLLAILSGMSNAEAEKEKTNAQTSENGLREDMQFAGRVTALVGQIAPGTPFAGEAVAVLTEVVRAGRNFQPERAAQVLGDFGPVAEPALPELVKFARKTMTTHGTAGPRAIEALGRIAPGTKSADDVVTVLLEALHSENMAARRAAIEVLPKFGNAAARAIPALRALLDDPDASIRSAAAAVLEQRN